MNELSPIIRVIDLETTGSRPPEHGVVEIGWQDVERVGEGWQVSPTRGARLVSPGRPIPPKTSAVHHLMDEDVVGCPPWPEAARDVLAPPGRAPLAFAAHRAAFEQRWCGDELTGGLPWICTWKCALRLWPEAPSFSNQVLRYWRRPEGLDRGLALPAHRAGPDAYVTAHHLRDMLALAPVQQLITWSDEPALLARVPFGPHRGRRFEEVDREVLEHFLRGEAERDADLRHTARQELERRARGDHAAERDAPERAGAGP